MMLSVVVTILLFIAPIVTGSGHQEQGLPEQTTDTTSSTSPGAVSKGMTKKQVRSLWGEPREVRRVRTCFGSQEEWLYRGDPQRYGGEERLLLFNEEEVLEDIK
jgi:hypothetical protein